MIFHVESLYAQLFEVMLKSDVASSRKSSFKLRMEENEEMPVRLCPGYGSVIVMVVKVLFSVTQ